MTEADWWLLAWMIALLILSVVVTLLWEDKRTRGRNWCSVFYRAPMSWVEYFGDKKRKRRKSDG